MKCPIDGSDLVMTDRQGIEIDYCPTCRGVWLDRGELDKIIDRTAIAFGRDEPEPYQERESLPGAFRPEYREEYRDEHRRPEHGGHASRRKRRGSFLGDLFDID